MIPNSDWNLVVRFRRLSVKRAPFLSPSFIQMDMTKLWHKIEKVNSF